MKRLLIALTCLYTTSAFTGDKFFANQLQQEKTPLAFALQKESFNFLQQSNSITFAHANQLISAIKKQPQLVAAISQWSSLDIAQQVPYLRQIFTLEYKAFGIKPPQLIIDTVSYPGKTVYFDFDVTSPSTGTVYLNPDKLSKMDKFAALAFLIHETRHSYQFQLAYSGQSTDISKGYKQAFITQKASLPGSLSFSDFLTLVNEYEAFMFGNYVIGQLTNWQVDQSSLGTYASQFDNKGHLKIDLLKLHKESGSSSIVAPFNQKMIAQKEHLKR